jgi:hypothetical protein
MSSSSRPISARKFVFLKPDVPNTLQAATPRHTSNDQRLQDSPKKKLLFAIKRDLQAASAPMKVAAADPVRLLQSLEAARCAPLTSNPMSGSATAVQLSQSVALIERFVVDQLPQGRTGDDLLAAWNCVVAHSVRAAPLERHARPRVAEQLRCKAEMASTSHGSRVMVFRADNSSSELAIVARIEELLAPVQPLEQALLQSRRAKASSPRARFLRPQMQHANHGHSSNGASSRSVFSVPVKMSAGRQSSTVGEMANSLHSEPAEQSNNGHFEKLIQALGCGDQRVQTRELYKELDSIRDSLKHMKGRITLLTENLDVPARSETPTLALEPHERSVRAALSLVICR